MCNCTGPTNPRHACFQRSACLLPLLCFLAKVVDGIASIQCCSCHEELSCVVKCSVQAVLWAERVKAPSLMVQPLVQATTHSYIDSKTIRLFSILACSAHTELTYLNLKCLWPQRQRTSRPITARRATPLRR